MFIRWMNERFPAFGAEYDVDVVSYEDCPMVLCFICYDYYVHYPDGRCPGFRRWALPVAHIFRPFRAVQFPGLFDGRCPIALFRWALPVAHIFRPFRAAQFYRFAQWVLPNFIIPMGVARRSHISPIQGCPISRFIRWALPECIIPMGVARRSHISPLQGCPISRFIRWALPIVYILSPIRGCQCFVFINTDKGKM